MWQDVNINLSGLHRLSALPYDWSNYHPYCKTQNFPFSHDEIFVRAHSILFSVIYSQYTQTAIHSFTILTQVLAHPTSIVNLQNEVTC
ncbi:hypothetical protein C1H46_009565 [Malus baccata]|uniref:Uncharacterized protein n=1 Tax=Malus baccata TaxID=106549 RepID=A0A540N1B6_MALBA|nr:hypothetical protein C1H46_009565 [Malus baccata]